MSRYYYLIAFFLTFNFPFLKVKASPRCTNLFSKASSLVDLEPEGFINIFQISKQQKNDQEQAQKPQAAKHKKESVDFKAIQEILKTSDTQLSQLTPKQSLEIFNLFAKSNLLPPRSFSLRLQNHFKSQLNQWRATDFRNFARARKLTPLKLTRSFASLYKKMVLKQFSQFNVTTQMEVLGAELFHGTYLKTGEINFLFEQTTFSLKESNNSLHLKPLKELYRGLLFFRSGQTSFFFPSLVRLEMAIEQQLQSQGLSLTEGGTSGANNPQRPTDQNFKLLESRLDLLFQDQIKWHEFMAPDQLGFFDPVDLYYPQKGLVVEWDGPHHLFRQLNSQGILTDKSVFVLRPIDAAKDYALRRMGIAILRFPPQLTYKLSHVDLLELIQAQNPDLSFIYP